jgi:Flp pilus assembly pilin Flp
MASQMHNGEEAGSLASITILRGNMKNTLIRLWKEEEGQDLIEYGLLLVLIALLSVTFVTGIGKALNNVFSNANTILTSAAG